MFGLPLRIVMQFYTFKNTSESSIIDYAQKFDATLEKLLKKEKEFLSVQEANTNLTMENQSNIFSY
jgi:hypothetical protein